MPIYEYECANCKFYTEVIQKISEAPLIQCPSCGKKKMKKLISAPVFRLKGSGWYETDFKSDQESKRNLAGGAEPDDAKPAEKAEKDADASKVKPVEPADKKPAAESSDKSKSASKTSTSKKKSSAAKPAAKAKAKPKPKKRR